MGEQLTVDDSVPEWEAGLPSLDDLTPLSQPLIPALLASAFKITPDPPRTVVDINRASENTLSSIGIGMPFVTESNFKNFGHDHGVEEGNDEGLELNKCGRSEQGDDFLIDNGGDDQSTGMAKTLKRPRLVWTPQLHKRFVDVVAHLGLKNAVPKTIMQLMNVEGLTRENVASHLQKYRLYVKRMEGLSNEGPSPSDHLFASTPVPPQSFIESSSGGPSHGNGVSNGSHSSVGNGTSANSHVVVPMPMPYPPPQSIMPMQMMGMTCHGHGCIRYDVAQAQHNEHYQQQFMNMEQHQRNWQANLPNGYPQGLSHNNSKC